MHVHISHLLHHMFTFHICYTTCLHFTFHICYTTCSHFTFVTLHVHISHLLHHMFTFHICNTTCSHFTFVTFHIIIAMLWLATGRWFSPGTPVFSTNKTDRHDITEILLKLVLKVTGHWYVTFTWLPCSLVTKHFISD
jgi:hypothetical protein